MADLRRLSALESHVRPGRYGADSHGEPGVVLLERQPPTVAQVNDAPDGESFGQALGFLDLEAPPVSRRACQGKRATLLWNGPRRWLAVSADAPPARFVDDLRGALQGTDATVTDLSHARTVVRISGAAARQVLLTGCPLDLERFGENDCAASLLGHLSVQLHCLGADGFDVYVLRSFAASLWEWLVDASLEYGLEVRART